MFVAIFVRIIGAVLGMLGTNFVEGLGGLPIPSAPDQGLDKSTGQASGGSSSTRRKTTQIQMMIELSGSDTCPRCRVPTTTELCC